MLWTTPWELLVVQLTSARCIDLISEECQNPSIIRQFIAIIDSFKWADKIQLVIEMQIFHIVNTIYGNKEQELR